jgi:hypothetical protein
MLAERYQHDARPLEQVVLHIRQSLSQYHERAAQLNALLNEAIPMVFFLPRASLC